jgi:dienelactone hydrolase
MKPLAAYEHLLYQTMGLLLLMVAVPFPLPAGADAAEKERQDMWEVIAPNFTPPPELAGELGEYASPLRFGDGRRVADASQWPARRAEILTTWHGIMGAWPELIATPRIEYLDQQARDSFTQHRVRIEVAAGTMLDGYLMVPEGAGPFPAVLVVYYEPETSAGLNENRLRDFGYQFALRGFVTLSIGSPPVDARDPKVPEAGLQPLSYLAYVAANCHTALASLPEVDGERIGVTGHSYGSKWAMFASCLYERFAAAAWSDGGIVFDESRANVNYWEPWYLGRDPLITRARGTIAPDRPRTGAYRQLVEQGHDLHELHALMPPRPFLVSGGSEDPVERWVPLNHTIDVNHLLGYSHRVGMTNRPTHAPTAESNAVLYAFFEHFLKEQTGEQPGSASIP